MEVTSNNQSGWIVLLLLCGYIFFTYASLYASHRSATISTNARALVFANTVVSILSGLVALIVFDRWWGLVLIISGVAAIAMLLSPRRLK